ncbi:peroxide stress protein YaaA [Pengzhenrongella sp.]|uniref:YaaA family protein n=1 Tax=Pengzhenrongella sp. TaxID=2888820 RepID=UPI002F943AC4
MLVLLPPSESKTAPDDGAPVDLAALGSPGLTKHRSVVLRALAKASARRDAAAVLGVGPSLLAEVAANRHLRTGPSAAASSVYSGVLYAAAGLADLPDDAARARAEDSIRIVSALWGLVRPADRIPAYRLSMGTDLPGVGPLARAWRPLLAVELDPRAIAGELIVDCRSAPYVAAWRPPSGTAGSTPSGTAGSTPTGTAGSTPTGTAGSTRSLPPIGGARWVAVRVLRELAGRRTVVSHSAKHTRGVLIRHLLVRPGPEPTTPLELLDAARELIGVDLLDAELSDPTSARTPHLLTLTVT